MSNDLVKFLRDRLDSDEAGARDAFGDHNDGSPEWTEVSSGALDAGGELHGIGDSAVSRHMARWDPARVLAEVDAKRRIIADCVYVLEYEDHGHWIANRVLAGLALSYRDHPDYRPEWTPGA